MIAENDLQLLKENNIPLYPNETVFWVGRPSRSCYKKKSNERNYIGLLSAAPLIVAWAMALFGLYRQSEKGFWCTMFLTLIAVIYYIHSFFNDVSDLEHSVYVITDSRLIIYRKFWAEQVMFLQIADIISMQVTERTRHQGTPIGTIAVDTGKTYIDNETGEPEKIFDYFEFIEYPKEVHVHIETMRKNKDKPNP